MSESFEDNLQQAEQTVEEIAPQENPAHQDLSTTDLIQEGALPEDLEHGQMGRHTYEADMAEPASDDTIDDRVRQEVPEEGFDVVPDQLREQQ